jgi:hypothetical protein
MKRKVYLVQSAIGQNATRYSFNAAMGDAARGMVRDYAESLGLRGAWSLTDSGKETAPGDAYLTVHGWRVWQHDATGAKLRIVCNLQP